MKRFPQLTQTFVVTELRELGAKHLHAHFDGWAGQAARRVAEATGIGYSVTAHATDIYRAGVDEGALAALIAEARFVVTVTEDNRKHLERLRAAGRDVSCVIVGDGPLRGSLARQIVESGLSDTVELAVGLEHHAVLDLLRTALSQDHHRPVAIVRISRKGSTSELSPLARISLVRPTCRSLRMPASNRRATSRWAVG